jgi:hypothetical protein
MDTTDSNVIPFTNSPLNVMEVIDVSAEVAIIAVQSLSVQRNLEKLLTQIVRKQDLKIADIQALYDQTKSHARSAVQLMEELN